MGFYNYIAKSSLPISDLINNRRVGHYLRFLGKSQFWSKDKIQVCQNDRLRKLIDHAYANVPFYKELFDQYGVRPTQIQDTSDLAKLPILSKKDIRDGINSGKLIDQTARLSKLEKNNSSGSTGEPLKFYLDSEASSIKKATAIRAWQWMGFNLGDKILRISPLRRNGLIKHVQDIMTRTHYMQAYKFNEAEFAKMAKVMIEFAPSVLRSYPDPLFLFSKYIKSHGIKPPKLTAINTTGSTLHDAYRDYIEDVFSCRIFDSFSCEGGAGVSQCSHSAAYHVADEYAITEVVDNTGNHTKMGRLITTDLWNFATPFIRYDTQDMVEISEDQCPCGRGLMTIKKIFGRSSDILVTPNKQFLFANNFTGHFQDISGVDQYQIHQKSLNQIAVYVKTNNKYDSSTSKMIMDLMRGIIGDSVNISIEVVDDIPVSKSGKRRFLIRDESVPLVLDE
jgi:phenylacetate-CoA ligase